MKNKILLIGNKEYSRRLISGLNKLIQNRDHRWEYYRRYFNQYNKEQILYMWSGIYYNGKSDQRR